MKKIVIDGAAIKDEESFHDVFSEALGFPGFYGRNFSAWVDCMSYVDEKESEMTTVCVEPGDMLVIAIEGADEFKRNCPELWLVFLECAAFVNWRRVEKQENAVLVVSAYA